MKCKIQTKDLDVKTISNLYLAYESLKEIDHPKIINNVIRIDVQKLLKYVPDLILEISENLKHILGLANNTFKTIDEEKYDYEFYNLPEDLIRPIPDLRASDLETFIQVSGKLVAKGEIIPRIYMGNYECYNCSKTIEKISPPFSFENPKKTIKCSCGNNMNLMETKMEDLLYLKLEENAEDVSLENPQGLTIALKGRHTKLKELKKMKMGVKVDVTGILKLRKFDPRKEGDKVLILDSINYIKKEEDLALTEEDKIKFDLLKNDKERITKLCNMLDNDVLGYQDIKESLLYYLAGSEDTSKFNGTINVLLIGEPGTAKSQLAKAIELIASKVRYCSGKNSTNAGLTAGVVKDEALGSGYSIKLGALPLCNGGHVIADELDKLTDDDKSGLLEAMSLGTVSINKIVTGKFEAKTAVLGIANPKKIKFDNKSSVYEQLGFTQDLFSRFDFIWVIKNEVDQIKDGAIASILLSTMFKDKVEVENTDQKFLKKYIKYVSKKFKPRLEPNNDECSSAASIISEFYVKSRARDSNLTARAVNSIIKIANAHAKLRQSNVIESEDAMNAIKIYNKTLEKLI